MAPQNSPFITPLEKNWTGPSGEKSVHDNPRKLTSLITLPVSHWSNTSSTNMRGDQDLRPGIWLICWDVFRQNIEVFIFVAWMGEIWTRCERDFDRHRQRQSDPFVQDPFHAHSSCALQALIYVAQCDGIECNQICRTVALLAPPTSWHWTPWNFVKPVQDAGLSNSSSCQAQNQVDAHPIQTPLHPFLDPLSDPSLLHSGSGRSKHSHTHSGRS